jgi:hypothetical protein
VTDRASSLVRRVCAGRRGRPAMLDPEWPGGSHPTAPERSLADSLPPRCHVAATREIDDRCRSHRATGSLNQRASQAEGRGFEPHLPLHPHQIGMGRKPPRRGDHVAVQLPSICHQWRRSRLSVPGLFAVRHPRSSAARPRQRAGVAVNSPCPPAPDPARDFEHGGVADGPHTKSKSTVAIRLAAVASGTGRHPTR